MKFGLFIALLVLLASTNVFGRQKTVVTVDSSETKDDGHGGDQVPSTKEDPSSVVITPTKVTVNTERKDRIDFSPVKADVTSDSTEGSTVDTPSTELKPDPQRTQRLTVTKEETAPTAVEVRPNPQEHREETTHLAVTGDESQDRKAVIAVPHTDPMVIPENHVHVSGNIVLVKYLPSFIDPVQYDLEGARLTNGGRPLPQSQPFAQDFVARQSRITLYAATTKTTDPKLAFAKFPIQYDSDHFPFVFDIDVELPSQQRGLLERAEITLYFFVYVTNRDTNIDTHLPAGTSQILLQGTNRLVQKLDVYVKASGIEISGLFSGRFGQQLIQSGTALQIFIVPEYSLSLRFTTTFESVAQLTINSLPAMFPVPFSLMVNYQSLKPNTKYYAIAFIFENGVQRPVPQEPIWVINEQNVLVTSQVVFNVIPSPFIIRGTISRTMPGAYYLPPGSALIIRLHEIGSDSQDIIYKLPEILTFPQIFQINISQSSRFDASKKYDIRALIMNEKGDIFMASLQPIPLLDDLSRLIVPVDDLLYNVQVRLQASSNQYLTYIKGSSAQVFVTESPETPTKPIVAIRIDSIASDFRDFSIQVPTTAIQRGRNYYLVMMIEMNGMITHVSKILLVSNNQPPPFVIILPVLSLNLVSGVIYDKDNRPAQWTSSSYANVYLVDDHAADLNNNVVQVWKVHVENDFPIRFEVQLDFSRLLSGHVYRVQAAIENGLSLIEYKPAGSVLTLNSNGGIITDLRLPVVNVKTSQRVNGLILISDFRGPFPEKSEIVVQLSSSPSLSHPRIINELRIKVEGRDLPIDFFMDLPLDKIDMSSVYYFFVQYVVRDSVVIPVSQAFAVSLRNDATVVLTLSKTPQIPITGQVTSTGSPLILPDNATLHIYITDDATNAKPHIISEVFLSASPNSLYAFTMYIEALILQKQSSLYLRADILYQDSIILSIPRPAELHITPGGEWNINLVVDLPTILVGQIISMSQYEQVGGDFEVYIQILESDSTHVVTTALIRLEAKFPQGFRIEIDNAYLVQYPHLRARAIIKNCKEQVLFEAGGFVDIHAGINVKVDLPVVLTNPERFKELHVNVNQVASLYSGSWQVSIIGTVTGATNSLLVGKDGVAITALDPDLVRKSQ